MIHHIDTLTSERAARLSTLHTQAFEGVSRGWRADELTALTSQGALIAADDDRGFALLSLAVDEAELLAICTAPAARRSGLSARLLDACEAHAAAKGATTVFLEVAADNTAAIALYRKAHFTEIARRPRYYTRPTGRVDALIMSKNLSREAP